MTRLTLTTSRRKRNGGRNGPRAERLAALHLRGDRLFIALAAPEAEGVVRITETHAFARGEAEQAVRVLARQKVDRIIGVVPSAQSIVRLAGAPVLEGGVDDSALTGALDLIAEAELGPVAPPHRRSAGIVAPGGPGSKPVALAQCWTTPAGTAADASTEALAHAHLEPHAWITTPAALAALAQALGGATLVTEADFDTGAATIIAAAGGQTVARVVRLDNSSAETWRAELAQACAETTGFEGQPVESGTGFEPVEEAPAASGPAKGPPRLKGLPQRPEAVASWLRDFGPCAGALAAAASTDPALEALASLHRRPPEQERPAIVRLAAWLGEPKRAAVIVAACVLIALLLPVATAYGRWWMLNERAGGRAALSQRLDEARDTAEFHRLLSQERWPIAKLLADVASSAPEGVQLDVLDLSRSGGLSIRGTAESTGLITQFRENLAKTLVFSAIEVPTRAESASNVEFQLNARIDNPYYDRVVIDDFGSRTLFHRIYGEDAIPSDGPPAARAATADAGPRDRTPRSTRRTEQGGGDEPRAASRRDAPAAAQIPPPLTDEALAAMDATAAREAMTQRTAALSRTDLDETTRKRLQDEQARARSRMLQAFQEQRR